MPPRYFEKYTGISLTSVKPMIKRRGLNQFKRLKTSMMSSNTKERRTKRAAALEIGLGKVFLSKKVYGKMKTILLWMFLETLKTAMSIELEIKIILKIIYYSITPIDSRKR